MYATQCYAALEINKVSLEYMQKVKGKMYDFTSWSDGGAQTHTITAPAASATYTAVYTRRPR